MTSDLPETTQALSGQYLAPEAQAEADKKLAPLSGLMTAGLLAAPVAAAAAAPTVTAGTVGTGILDASGDEIMREVAKYGPSLGKQALGDAVSWIGRHKLLSAAAYEGARRLGVPLPNVIGWLSKAASE